MLPLHGPIGNAELIKVGILEMLGKGEEGNVSIGEVADAFFEGSAIAGDGG
jgi:hypothetical protein